MLDKSALKLINEPRLGEKRAGWGDSLLIFFIQLGVAFVGFSHGISTLLLLLLLDPVFDQTFHDRRLFAAWGVAFEFDNDLFAEFEIFFSFRAGCHLKL